MEEESLQAYIDHKNMISETSINLSAEEITRIKAELEDFQKGNKVLFSFEGDTAHMEISGVLEPKPDMCAIMFGFDMTTYQDIIEAIHEAEKNEAIQNMEILFDTPGGNVTGLFATCDVIRNSRLHFTGIVTGMCASAGFALISQCDIIKTQNQSNEVGSIGVRTDMIDRSEQDKMNGIVRHTLVSSNAPNKVVDISTKDGQQNVIDRLTKLEGVFIHTVAVGRNTTTDDVIKNFGQGGMLIADDALKVGMIDDIISVLPEARNTTGKDSKNNKTETKLQGDNMADITMSEEQLNKLVSDTATKAVEGATASFNASMVERDKISLAETNRKAGFITMANNYPEMSEMINKEMAVEGATADADFFIKVASADKARIAALDEQNTNSENNTNSDAIPKNPDNETTDNSGDRLAASMGIELEAEVK
jgi:ClpP class serine protease